MSALVCAGLRAGYGTLEIVRDVFVQVAPGEIVALLGVNGAGKTTTVRAIAGIIPTLGGRVLVDGADVSRERPHQRARRGLAVVTDARPVCRSMTVESNLRLAAREADHRDVVTAWFPELGPLLKHLAGTLSGGEQQLVALARALVSKPKVLIVDELSAGLAPALAARAMSGLRRAADEWGTGILVAEQATALALKASDRALVLAHGRVVIAGSADELANRREVLETAYLGGSPGEFDA